MFPAVDEEAWREAVFGLAWRTHGGSGLGLDLPSVLELSIAFRDWLLERVATQRQREAQALRRTPVG
ncbi:MAG: hypothetical protein HS111_09780 [Kofleriaceae bacterium]|nr:hypothetical protein [Kofleriaceae bacterium]